MENKNYMNVEMNEAELDNIAGGYIKPLFPIKPAKPNPVKKWKTVWDMIRESILL